MAGGRWIRSALLALVLAGTLWALVQAIGAWRRLQAALQPAVELHDGIQLGLQGLPAFLRP